jgi:hypothetical protein
MAYPQTSFELWPELAAALDIPPTLLVQKAVIVIDEDEAVRVYLKTLLRQTNAEKLVGCFRVTTVADVLLADDAIVTVIPHAPEPT